MKEEIFTIGHSNHSITEYLSLLGKYDITTLVDVRSAPYSRRNPQFNREDLKQELEARGIKYVFLGKELGARSSDPSCYEGDKVKYQYIAGTALFKEGLQRMRDGVKKYTIALMCAEKDPLDCHRTILVGRYLAEEGYDIKHILADGNLEVHSDTMNRLMERVGIPKEDMFNTKEELQKKALDKQSDIIAYSRSAPDKPFSSSTVDI